jgi:hypothetical protein
LLSLPFGGIEDAVSGSAHRSTIDEQAVPPCPSCFRFVAPPLAPDVTVSRTVGIAESGRARGLIGSGLAGLANPMTCAGGQL